MHGNTHRNYLPGRNLELSSYGNTITKQYTLLHTPLSPEAMKRNWHTTFALHSRRLTLVHRARRRPRSKPRPANQVRSGRHGRRTGSPNHTKRIEFTAMQNPKNETRKIIKAYTNPHRYGIAERILEFKNLSKTCRTNIESNVTHSHDEVIRESTSSRPCTLSWRCQEAVGQRIRLNNP